ncbi:MAG: hypothetical protein GY946_01070 [bacterium]|nr:hypothetical protein [bacterium]
MSSECLDHLEFVGGKCPDCSLSVDAYGNTEDQFDNCSFPDCGCDGSRLCMAGEPSGRAMFGNVEGMWSGGSKEQRDARSRLIVRTMREDRETPHAD